MTICFVGTIGTNRTNDLTPKFERFFICSSFLKFAKNIGNLCFVVSIVSCFTHWGNVVMGTRRSFEWDFSHTTELCINLCALYSLFLEETMIAVTPRPKYWRDMSPCPKRHWGNYYYPKNGKTCDIAFKVMAVILDFQKYALEVVTWQFFFQMFESWQ